MTCIVAITNGKTITMGGDSLGSAGSHGQSRADTKVFINGDYIIGFTTSFRMGDLLKHHFKPPAPPTQKTTQNAYHAKAKLESFMATKFIDSVIMLFDKHNWSKSLNGRKDGGEFIVGTRGCLFHIADDFQLGIPLQRYTACGSGSDVALGAMYSYLEISTVIPKDKQVVIHHTDAVETALIAAEEHGTYVRGPFTILQLKN